MLGIIACRGRLERSIDMVWMASPQGQVRLRIGRGLTSGCPPRTQVLPSPKNYEATLVQSILLGGCRPLPDLPPVVLKLMEAAALVSLLRHN